MLYLTYSKNGIPLLFSAENTEYIVLYIKSQIKSVAIHQPRLTATLPGRLTDAFNSLPRLETVIITQPTAIHNLPHPNSVRCMKLHHTSQVQRRLAMGGVHKRPGRDRRVIHGHSYRILSYTSGKPRGTHTSPWSECRMYCVIC